MKIVIPGGTGHVGTVLARAFHEACHDVVVLSRSPRPAPWRMVHWDGRTSGPWASELEGADAVINLAGRSVNCRYGAKNRREIMDSRVESTRIVGKAISGASAPPKVWLQAGTATIYEHRYDAPNDEFSGLIGGTEPGAPDTWRFSIDVATRWEQTMNGTSTPSTRKVLLRSAILMSPGEGGPFDILLRLVRFGLGGRSGDGRQYVSWIHDRDFVRSIFWILEHPEMEGPVNLCSPNPLPNSEFMRALRGAWGIPVGLPAADWMLEVGAVLLRTETELILKSRRVAPSRLAASGFSFGFPDWADASRDLCARWRKRHRHPENQP
ncbi:MAG: TIGR01777 family protein [Chthoniobacterales bacterium]|nr:TIGR01777 family protein [Chthoniobacterales bacterium]